jgi:hypothetical protein
MRWFFTEHCERFPGSPTNRESLDDDCHQMTRPKKPIKSTGQDEECELDILENDKSTRMPSRQQLQEPTTSI